MPTGAVGAAVGGEVLAGVGDATGAAGLFAGAVAAFTAGGAVEPVGRDGHGNPCSWCGVLVVSVGEAAQLLVEFLLFLRRIRTSS